jgi:hypothetical protein
MDINIILSLFTALVRNSGRLLIYSRHSVGLLWMRDRSVEKASTCTGQHNTKDEDKHPCLKRDSKPRSQRPSDQDVRFRPRGN